MGTLNVDLDDEQINAALNKAILDVIGEKGREAIVQHAVKYLTTPDKTYNQRAVSPLVNIIQGAAQNIARKILEDKMANDEEFLAEVEAAYTEATRKFLHKDNREKLIDNLVYKMTEGLSDR